MNTQKKQLKPAPVPRDYFALTSRPEMKLYGITVKNIPAENGKFYTIHPKKIKLGIAKKQGEFGYDIPITRDDNKPIDLLITDAELKYNPASTMSSSGDKSIALSIKLFDNFLENFLFYCEHAYLEELKPFATDKYGSMPKLTSCMPMKYGVKADNKRPNEPILQKIKIGFYQGKATEKWFPKIFNLIPGLTDTEKAEYLKDSPIYTRRFLRESGVRIEKYVTAQKADRFKELNEEEQNEIKKEREIIYTHENINNYIGAGSKIDKLLIRVKGLWINQNQVSLRLVARIILYTENVEEQYDLVDKSEVEVTTDAPVNGADDDEEYDLD